MPLIFMLAIEPSTAFSCFSDTFKPSKITWPVGSVSHAAMKCVSRSDVVVDVSNDDSYTKSHIANAIHRPANSFFNSDGSLKAGGELAQGAGRCRHFE